MKKKILIITSIQLLNILLVFSIAEAQNHSPYLGQTPPGMTPVIFAPGIVSTPDTKEWSCTFSSDSNEMYFYRIYENNYCKLLFCKYENGAWTDPQELELTSAYSASEPHITLDNQRLYFLWDDGSSDIPMYFMANRTTDGWSAPVVAGQGMYLTSDLNGLLYTTDMSSVMVNGKIYLAEVTTDSGIFADYHRLVIQPYFGKQAHPGIAPDGSYIIFDIDGGNHMFVSFKRYDGNWSPAIDLTQHGFANESGGGYISPDGLYMFFQKDYDLWWVDTQVIKNLNPYLGLPDELKSSQNPVQLAIEPNPCRENIRIALKMDKTSLVSLQIADLNGISIQKLIDNKKIEAGELSMNFSLSELNLTNGIYLIILKTESGMTTEKLIIAK